MTDHQDAITSLPPRSSAYERVSSRQVVGQTSGADSSGAPRLSHDDDRLYKPYSERVTFLVQPDTSPVPETHRPGASSRVTLLAGDAVRPSIVLCAGSQEPAIDLDSYIQLDRPIPSNTPLKVILPTPMVSSYKPHRPDCSCRQCHEVDRLNSAAMNYFGVRPLGERRHAQSRPRVYPNAPPLLGWDWMNGPPSVVVPVQVAKEEKKRRPTSGRFNLSHPGGYIAKQARRVLKNIPGRPTPPDVGVNPEPARMYQKSCKASDNDDRGLQNPANRRTRVMSERSTARSRSPEADRAARKRSLERIQVEENRILRGTAAERFLGSKGKKGDLKYFRAQGAECESEVSLALRRKNSTAITCSTTTKYFNAKTSPEEKARIEMTRFRNQSHAYG